MFLGASLNPDYFTEKINVFVALAPVSVTAGITNKFIVEAASKLNIIEAAVVYGLGYYNWFAPMPMADGAIDVVCGIVPGVCKFVG